MNPRAHKLNSQIIVYDADSIARVNTRLFDEEAWKQSGKLVGTAKGRGTALFLETDFGPVVLRRYLRGGWAARFSQDRYLFTGYQRSRPVAEFKILLKLWSMDLPVPQPLAAQCVKGGLFYTGSLMTRRIENVEPFAERLLDEPGTHSLWSAVGRCIRRFHDSGVVHADLNARNILIDDNDRIYLIDFDRAKIMMGAQNQFESNLNRLQRSLRKLWPEGHSESLQKGWANLLAAYRLETPR